jgi:hypothetical protein
MLRFLAALAILVPGGALAQMTQGTPACKDGAIPFAATAANRLVGAQLQQAVTGKTVVYLRESLRNPGLWVRSMREHRADGSMLYTCEASRARTGPWVACKSIGSVERRVAGGRDVGVWSIKNENLCSTKAAFGERTEDCFAIHREGAVYAAKRVSGPLAACMQGEVTLQ